MARLLTESGRIDDLERIGRELRPLGVRLASWPIEDAGVRALLDRPTLSDAEKEQVLVGLDNYFERHAYAQAPSRSRPHQA